MESSDLEFRRATPDDRAAILHLGTRALDWLADAEEHAFFAWKHEQNPFGQSPMWVACDGDRVVGFRTFMRWEFLENGRRVIRAVRAVDTATDPEYQGRGIFTTLTLAALDDLRSEGIDMIFNTPNEKSLPGYLKMDWRVVGRLPVSIMPTQVRSLRTLFRARVPAARTGVLVNAGLAPGVAFADHETIADLLARTPVRPGLTTRRTPEFLAWRYGYEALHYRVLPVEDGIGAGFAVFRLRRRGAAMEAVICDVLIPTGRVGAERRLSRRTAEVAGVDYLLRLDRRLVTRDPFLRIPRIGPVLTFRGVVTPEAPRLEHWNLTMGDVELF